MYKRKVFLLSLLLLLASTVAHARILFHSERNGIDGVFVMDDDGSNQTLLTDDEFVAYSPSWSPDGRQILFNRYVFHSIVICLMNPDGTNVRELMDDNGGYIGRGSFSPDGQSILFEWQFYKNNEFKYGVYVLNIKTLKVEAIAPKITSSNCDWSPDGKHIISSE